MNPNHSPPIAEPANVHSPSLRQKLKSSLKLPSCFHMPDDPADHGGLVPSEYATPRLVRSTNAGPAGSRFSGQADGRDPHDHHFKDRAKHFISSRLGGGSGGGGGGASSRHKRRHSSVDFHYDEASYSLNFDDGGVHEGHDSSPDDFTPFRTFSSRLPASPPPRILVPPPKPRPTCT